MLDFMSMPSFRTFKQNRKERKGWDVRQILKGKMNAKAVEITKSRTKKPKIWSRTFFAKMLPKNWP